MKTKIMLVVLALMAVLLVGCTGSEDVQEQLPQNVQVDDDSMAMDTNNNGVADAQVEAPMDADEPTEVTIDLDDVQDEKTQAAIDDAISTGEFCVPGSTYTYEGDDGNVDSEVVGLTTYKGSEFCEATSTSVINSAIGEITTETVYYFDRTYSEYWIVATTSGAGMPTQTNEIHLVDGEVQ